MINVENNKAFRKKMVNKLKNFAINLAVTVIASIVFFAALYFYNDSGYTLKTDGSSDNATSGHVENVFYKKNLETGDSVCAYESSGNEYACGYVVIIFDKNVNISFPEGVDIRGKNLIIKKPIPNRLIMEPNDSSLGNFGTVHGVGGTKGFGDGNTVCAYDSAGDEFACGFVFLTHNRSITIQFDKNIDFRGKTLSVRPSSRKLKPELELKRKKDIAFKEGGDTWCLAGENDTPIGWCCFVGKNIYKISSNDRLCWKYDLSQMRTTSPEYGLCKEDAHGTWKPVKSFP